MKLRIVLTILALILMVSTKSYANDSEVKKSEQSPSESVELDMRHDVKSGESEHSSQEHSSSEESSSAEGTPSQR